MLRKTLSLCIPIYNRKAYLDKMLARFVEDRALFENDIELIISDNCSEDDLYFIVDKYKQQGLRLNYYRQDTNIGSDANFLFCFEKATGKYCWLLGSDDIPVSGFLQYLISEIDNDEEYGLIHIRIKEYNKWYRAIQTTNIYSRVDDNNQKFLSDINVWITFMSSNIINTTIISTVKWEKYKSSNLIQVPFYVKSCLSSEKNLLINYNYCFEPDNDDASSGGYNFYGVFVKNLLSILQDFVSEGLMTDSGYRKFKRKEYNNYLLGNTKKIFVDRDDKIHRVDGVIKIMWEYYGKELYSYIDALRYVVVRTIAQLINK